MLEQGRRPGIVHVVDDDPGVRDAIACFLRGHALEVATYAAGEELLAKAGDLDPGCVVMDVNMPGSNGISVQAALHDLRPDLEVILITGAAAIPLAVQAVKGGAHDFLEKPVKPATLLRSVQSALAAAETHCCSPANGLAQLTCREREVLRLLVQGLTNKEIAKRLECSPRTVEIHRARTMLKLRANSLAELVKVAIAAGLA